MHKLGAGLHCQKFVSQKRAKQMTTVRKAELSTTPGLVENKPKETTVKVASLSHKRRPRLHPFHDILLVVSSR